MIWCSGEGAQPCGCRSVVEAAARLRCANSTGADESLRFVGPEDEQVVATALVGGLVEAAQRVGVEEHLQERVHGAALDLELLRHGDADDFAAINVCEVEGVRAGAEDLGDLGRDECLEVVRDGLPAPSAACASAIGGP